MDYHLIFNERFQDYLNDLKRVFPSMSEMVVYETMFHAMATLDKTMPLKLFYDKVGKDYDKMIMEKNEQFFLTTDFSKIEDGHLIQFLKDKWQTLNDTNKNAIWDHLRLLMTIAKKAI